MRDIFACILSFICIFLDIEQSFKVSKSVICLLFGDMGSNSAFASHNFAPTTDEEGPCLVSTHLFVAGVLSPIVELLELLQKQSGSV